MTQFRYLDLLNKLSRVGVEVGVGGWLDQMKIRLTQPSFSILGLWLDVDLKEKNFT